MKIFGYDYKILVVHNLGSSGMCQWTTGKIQLDRRLVPQQRTSTMLHEVLEAINGHLDLNMSHTSITALEVGLFQTLTDAGVDLAPLLSEAVGQFDEGDVV